MNTTFDPVSQFDNAPASMLVDICTACAISSRSRSSIYRHIKAGELPIIKVGHSTRIRVSEIRRLIGATA